MIFGHVGESAKLRTGLTVLFCFLPLLIAAQQKATDPGAINEIITFEASDSLSMSADGIAHLYREGKVTYGQMNLTGDFIVMNSDSSTIYARGVQDSTGQWSGRPVFKDQSGEYQSHEMRYNFVSQKGIITNVVTQQGDGYVVSGRTKKMDDDAMYMAKGKYTTCDNHEHPHFYLDLSRAKVRPGKDIVTGPAHVVVEDVDLPLFVPFGYFPFSSEYSSGIITPTYGDELNRGFYLRDGGYYFALSDYFDLALTGEIYSKGSWGVKARTAYRKRYKFSGNFSFSYLVTANSERRLPDYSESKNMNLVWSHSQDSKANPYSSFSASVNFATSGYSRTDLSTLYNAAAFNENTKSSSINYSRRFPTLPLSISMSASVSQRTKDSTLTVSLPNLSLNLSRIYPFKRKEAVGKERFYEKISLSYSGNLTNSINSVKEKEFFQKSLIKDWRNGMKHSIPVSATFNVLNYINLTPSLSYTSRWYTSAVDRYYDTTAHVVRNDTTWGFYRVWDFQASVSASTKLYAFFQPMRFLFGENPKVNMVRWVLTPTVSLSYRPDFGRSWFGYYKTLEYTDQNGVPHSTTYSRFNGQLFGTPSSGESGSVNFSLANNVEMKWRNDRDTTGDNPFKKISLIDNFSFSTSYNIAADSLNWSNISANIRLKLGKNKTLSLSGQFDPYTYQLNSAGNPVKVNITQWQKNRIPGRLISTGTSFSYTFNNDTFKRKAKEGDEAKDGDKGKPAKEKPAKERREDPEADLYADYKVPWSLSLNYSISYSRGAFNKEKMEYGHRFTHNLGINGNISLTDKWKFTASTNFNFDTMSFSTMNCTVSRDLHCWVMSASFMPFGLYKSYNFSIRVKSGMLQDLKYEQHQNPRDNVVWGVRK